MHLFSLKLLETNFITMAPAASTSGDQYIIHNGLRKDKGSNASALQDHVTRWALSPHNCYLHNCVKRRLEYLKRNNNFILILLSGYNRI